MNSSGTHLNLERFFAALKLDMLVQWRIKLYLIGVLAGVIVAVAVAQITAANQLYLVIPALMLLVIGGSTMLYVAALVIFERDEATINAVIVSPLRTTEYLFAKIFSLLILITVECITMIGGSMFLIWLAGTGTEPLTVPNIGLLWLGITGNAVIYTLIGIILIVRYRRITEFLIPLAVVAIVLEIPVIYFLDIFMHPLLLVIPTSAPTLIIRGAFVECTRLEWAYAVGYSILLIIGLSFWGYHAFKKHLVMTIP